MEALLHDFLSWLGNLREPHALAQLLVIAIAGALAYVVDGQLARFVIGHPKNEGLRKLALRTAQRIVFPVSALAGVLMGRALFNALELPVELLNIAVPMMLSLAGIRLAVFLLRKSFAPSAALKAWESIISTAAWTVVALHLAGWLPDVLAAMDSVAFDAGKIHFSLLSFVKMLLFLAILLSLAVWISGIIEAQVRKAEHMSPGMQVGLTKVSKVVLVGLAVVIGLNAVGIDLTAFAVFGGALGVGLGFGLQRIASNFISGFILIMDRSIRPGDVISVGKNFGWVQELRARYVVVRNRDGVDTLIPNESLVTSEVVNWSYTDRKVRVRIPVQISYDDDPELAMDLMVQAAKSCNRVLPEPEPVCRLMNFGDNGLALELRVWIDDPEEGVGAIRSEINLSIWKAFKRHNVKIPYPHQELYVKEWPDPTHGHGSLTDEERAA